jgi:deoxyribonuclease-4
MLGIHVSKESQVLDDDKSIDMHLAIKRDLDALGLNAVQIFTHGPRFFVTNKLNYAAIKAATREIDISVHSAYATTNIWQYAGNAESASDDNYRLEMIRAQMISTKKIGGNRLVLHINKVEPEVIAKVMKKIKPIAIKTGVQLLLEMIAAKADPDTTYETPAKLDRLANAIGIEAWWGYCVDTAHIWGAGVNITKYEEMAKWIKTLKCKKQVKMIHLNGSSADRGSGKDKHEIAFSASDKIWGKIAPEKSGLRAIVEFAVKSQIPVICEINRGAEEDVRKSIEIIKVLMKS